MIMVNYYSNFQVYHHSDVSEFSSSVLPTLASKSTTFFFSKFAKSRILWDVDFFPGVAKRQSGGGHGTGVDDKPICLVFGSETQGLNDLGFFFH